MGIFKRKPSVDPTDFLALRAELVDLRARLDAAEQDKATVEARLHSLDAAAAGITSERTEVDAIKASIGELRTQIDAAPQAAPGGDAALAAKVDALHSRLTNLTDTVNAQAEQTAQLAAASTDAEPAAAGTGMSDEQASQLADLHERVGRLTQLELHVAEVADLARAAASDAGAATAAVHAAQAAGGMANGPATTATPVAPVQAAPDPELLRRLAELESRVALVAARADASRLTAAPPPPAIIPEPIAGFDQAKWDELDRKLSGLDTMSMQINQLNARVSAQAELGSQISGLRDRISQLQEQAGADDHLREQVTLLTQRAKNTDDVPAQVAALAQQMGAANADQQATREHLTTLERRLAGMGTELANQISEVGRDIDNLANRPAPTSDPTAASEQTLITDEMIDALRTSQVKLANEQARYEIAFRQDLATLAEQVRRGQVR
jgi:chromosome segregation ATPase